MNAAAGLHGPQPSHQLLPGNAEANDVSDREANAGVFALELPAWIAKEGPAGGVLGAGHDQHARACFSRNKR